MTAGETLENYLENIHMLALSMDKVRQRDVCAAMGYSRPTVSVTLRNLRDQGYLDITEEGTITLTEQGREIAERIYERHCVIADMFIHMGVDRDMAYEDACKIEHDLSEETFQKLKEHYEKSQKKGWY